MPGFTREDARRHKKGLNNDRADKWAIVAERVLASCRSRGGRTLSDCEAIAIATANRTIGDSADGVPAFVLDSREPAALAEFQGEVLDGFVVDEQGVMTAEVVISQEGVLPYLVDGKLEHWYIPAEELASDEFLESCHGKPSTDGHPAEREVTMDSLSHLSKGVLIGPFAKVKSPEGKLQIRGREIIWDSELVAQIKEGKKRQVSIGRWAALVDQAGEYDGRPYNRVQRHLRLNHLAHTDAGRQGDTCRILVDMLDPQTADRRLEMLSGLPIVSQADALIAYVDESMKDEASGVTLGFVSNIRWRIRNLKRALEDAASLDAEEAGTFKAKLAVLNKRFPDIKTTLDESDFEAVEWKGPEAGQSVGDILDCLPPMLAEAARARANERGGEILATDCVGPIRRQPGAPMNVNALRALCDGKGAAIDGVDQAVAESARRWCRTQLQGYEKRGDAVPDLVLKVGDSTLTLGTGGLDDAGKTALTASVSGFQKIIDDAIAEAKKGAAVPPAPQPVVDATEFAALKSANDALRDQIRAIMDERNSQPKAGDIAVLAADEVEERATLTLIGKQVIGDAFVTKGRTTPDLRRDIVAARFPREKDALMGKDSKGAWIKDDAYIAARFDSIRDGLTDLVGQPVGAGMVRPAGGPVADGVDKEIEDARKARLNRFRMSPAAAAK